MLKNNGVIVDVKTAFMNFRDSKNYTYWALQKKLLAQRIANKNH